MPYKNQNYMTNYLIKEEVDKLQKDYVDPNQQEASEEKLYYSFTSYGDAQATEELATGVVEILAQEETYISVKVTENSVEGFVGNTYYLQPDAVANTQTLYQLYTDNELKNGTGMYVSITSIEKEKLYYSFTSYGDGQGTEQLAIGIVEILAKEKDYISVKVTENSVEGFVGNTYYLQPDTVADTQLLYELYTDNELKNSTGMYVSITSIEEENQEENGAK